MPALLEPSFNAGKFNSATRHMLKFSRETYLVLSEAGFTEDRNLFRPSSASLWVSTIVGWERYYEEVLTLEVNFNGNVKLIGLF